MKLLIHFAALACAFGCMAASAAPPSENVTPLLGQPIANLPGKTFTSAVVEFPPGAKAGPHRHGEAFVYAYVLSGNVRSQLEDAPAKVYRAGENWYEAPGAHHVLTENASRTKPARLLVVFVGPTGAPLKVPDPR
ncbi:cupin domain-containing protein [Variovorax sp. dw_954]|uniref:cupin domain-containing protein n=1 Tax=Variovorax sp. dw_954 TaxID=2720078 RepID=UPI0031F71780